MGFAKLQLFFLLIVLKYDFAYGQLSTDKDTLLNWCLDSKTHKHKPGKEDDLHGECLPWKDHACCTGGTTHDLHNTDMYNFTLDHCYNQTGHNMSTGCRKHFFRNNCFYECEPHIGLWVVESKRKIAKQQLYKVPLCASDCDDWWDACKEDYTCAYSWPKDFDFRNGRNYCRDQCNTFQNIYQTAQNFCSSIWDESYVYTPDDQACMRLWFNGSMGNPNRHAAEYYIHLKFGGSSSIFSNNVNFVIAALIAFILICQ